MLFSIARPAIAAPSNILPRASRFFGLMRTSGKAVMQSLNAWRENIAESGFRFLVTAVSRAWARASIPVQAVTRNGCDSVSAGPRIAIRAEAFGASQAIF